MHKIESFILSRLRRASKSKLLKKISSAFFINLLGLAISYCLQLSLARSLNLSDYGNYVFIVALSVTIANFVGLGIPITNLKFIPSYLSQQKWSLTKGLIRTSYLFTVSLSIAFVVVASSIVFFLQNLLNIGDAELLILSFLLVPLLSSILLGKEIIKALRRVSLALLPFSICYPLIILTGISILNLFSQELKLYYCIILSLFSLLLVLLIQQITLFFTIPGRVKVSSPEYEFKSWISLSLTLLTTKTFNIVLRQQIDILLIRAFVGPEEVALYNVAFKLSTLLNLVLVAANSVSAPLFSSLFSEGRKKDLQNLVAKEAHLIFWSSLAFFMGISLFSDFLLGLFGTEFLAAKPILFILLLGQLFNAAAGSVTYLLNMTGNQGIVAVILGISAFLNIALNLFLIPRYGSLGAALGTGLIMAVWNVWLSLLVIRRLDIKPGILGAFWVNAFESER